MIRQRNVYLLDTITVRVKVIDYIIDAPTSRITTIHSVVALVAHYGWKMHRLDVNIAFLNGDLEEEVYVKQPPGFAIKGQEHMVCHFLKALYGFKPGARAWYEKIHKHLIALGFTCSPIESTLYV
jgi:hypothetical protein